MARLTAIQGHLPERVLGNAELAAGWPGWSAQTILAKTGIAERRIAAPGETAADLAAHAARKLIDRTGLDPEGIDYLLFCTQSPDQLLPGTASQLQHRLGLPSTAGAVDVSMGCSGYVYSLGLAKGLIETGQARRLLLLTGDTYSRFIHPGDRSVRTLFGDGAAATLIEAQDPPVDGGDWIGPFVYGTDGSGADRLIIPAGGARLPRTADTSRETTDASGNVRSAEHLFMDGPAVVAFSLKRVPEAVAALLARTGRRIEAYDHIVLHQASAMVNDGLRRKLGVSADRCPGRLADCGNTVSSTIPLVLESLMDVGSGSGRALLVGFGVGLSWAACELRF